MCKPRYRPLQPAIRQLQDSLVHLTELLAAVTGAGPPPVNQDYGISSERLAQLQGVRQALQEAITRIDHQQSGRRGVATRRWHCSRRLPRVRIRPRRFRMPPKVLSPEELQVAAELASQRAQMRADLERQAVETVGATLERMRERGQETARSNPELQPYLAAFFEASRQTLLHTAGDLLMPTHSVDPMDVVQLSPKRRLDSVSDPDVPKEPEHGPA